MATTKVPRDVTPVDAKLKAKIIQLITPVAPSKPPVPPVIG